MSTRYTTRTNDTDELGGRCMASDTGFCPDWGYCRNCWDEDCRKTRKDTRTPKQNKNCFRCRNAQPVFLGIKCGR